MPSLQACGRRWNVASDDFYLPSLVEGTCRTAWYVPTRSYSSDRMGLGLYVDFIMLCVMWLYVDFIQHSRTDAESFPFGEKLIECFLFGLIGLIYQS